MKKSYKQIELTSKPNIQMRRIQILTLEEGHNKGYALQKKTKMHLNTSETTVEILLNVRAPQSRATNTSYCAPHEH